MSSAWKVLRSPERREGCKQQRATVSEAREDMAFFRLYLADHHRAGDDLSVAIALSAGHPPELPAVIWFFLGTTAAAIAMAVVIWIAFRFADGVVDLLGPTASQTVTRLFSSLLRCIGVQILITGVADELRLIIQG